MSVSLAAPVFSPDRVIVFSELSDRDKERMFDFLLDRKIEFFRDRNGDFAANVRMFDGELVGDMSQGRDATGSSLPGKVASPGSGPRKARGTGSEAPTVGDLDLSDNVAVATGVIGELISGFPTFCSRITSREAPNPKARPLPWLMRAIEELYDARYAKDTADLREDNDGAGGGGGGVGNTPFPLFAYDFYSKRYGLRTLVDQMAWELLYNVNLLRNEFLEVETFARFLEEYYDAEDMLFFLYVRSVLQQELDVGFRSRWAELGSRSKDKSSPSALFLTQKECQQVSRVVFGSEQDPLCKRFLSVMDAHYIGPRSGKPDARKLEVMQFLHLAVVEYHDQRPGVGGGGAGSDDGLLGGGSGAGGLGTSMDSAGEEKPADDGADASGEGKATAPQTSEANARRALLEALGECMHRTNEAFLDEQMAVCAGLAPDVIAQVRAEVETQLEAKVDGVLGAIIAASRGHGLQGDIPPSLVTQFQTLLSTASSGSEPQEIQDFCYAVLNTPAIKLEIEPVVALLTNYASSQGTS